MVPGFFADIDFATEKGSDKAYPPDEKIARAILDEFSLKPTLVVHSGNGLHVYWFADKPFVIGNESDRKQIKTILAGFGDRLSAQFKAHGFEIDKVSDIARLFRVPGSLNHKAKPPRPVQVISWAPKNRVSFEEIEASLGTTGSKASSSSRGDYRLADHDLIRGGCAWYAHCTGEGTAQCDEPNWYAAASITARCKDGEAKFLEYSKAHPEYDRRKAKAKFRRAKEETGPRTCRAINDDLGQDRFCGSCPHWEEIKSPNQLGYGYDPGRRGPIPLGYTNNGQFVFRDQTRNIIILATSSQLLNHQFLLGLEESDFWAKRYPSTKGLFNGLQAGEELIRACKMRGPFTSRAVRGRGVWREGKRIIVNLGGEIPHDVQNIYLCFEPLDTPEDPHFDTKRLLELLERFPWRRPQDAMLLLGWLVLAPICGALSWRPHCFVYGPPDSGKTTIHGISSNLLKPLGISVDGTSSEAGIRQDLGPDSRPFVIDEFETDQKKWRLDAVIRLARSASSSDSPVLRGTPEGKALQFSLRTMFFFSAVRVTGMSPQDETRILMLELKNHDGDPEIGKLIDDESDALSDSGPEWCGYMASHAHHIADGIAAFKAAMPSIESRHRLNMATLLAGAFIALEGRVPKPKEAEQWVKEFAPTVERHGLAHERDDASEALNHLFAHPVKGFRDMDMPFSHWIGVELEALRKGERQNAIRDSQRILASHDMKLVLEGENAGLLISNSSPAVNRIFATTRWANGAWRRAIGQIPGTFIPKNPVYFTTTKTKSRCIGLPFDLVPDPIYTAGDDGEF